MQNETELKVNFMPMPIVINTFQTPVEGYYNRCVSTGWMMGGTGPHDTTRLTHKLRELAAHSYFSTYTKQRKLIDQRGIVSRIISRLK